MNTQQEIKEAIFRERLKNLELVEETIADVENGQNPMDALTTLLTIAMDEMVEAGELAGMVTTSRIITKDGIFDLRIDDHHS